MSAVQASVNSWRKDSRLFCTQAYIVRRGFVKIKYFIVMCRGRKDGAMFASPRFHSLEEARKFKIAYEREHASSICEIEERTTN